MQEPSREQAGTGSKAGEHPLWVLRSGPTLGGHRGEPEALRELEGSTVRRKGAERDCKMRGGLSGISDTF